MVRIARIRASDSGRLNFDLNLPPPPPQSPDKVLIQGVETSDVGQPSCSNLSVESKQIKEVVNGKSSCSDPAASMEIENDSSHVESCDLSSSKEISQETLQQLVLPGTHPREISPIDPLEPKLQPNGEASAIVDKASSESLSVDDFQNKSQIKEVPATLNDGEGRPNLSVSDEPASISVKDSSQELETNNRDACISEPSSDIGDSGEASCIGPAVVTEGVDVDPDRKKSGIKDVKLGKKRGRQTMMLEVNESLQRARPPKLPLVQKSNAQLPSGRDIKENLQSPQISNVFSQKQYSPAHRQAVDSNIESRKREIGLDEVLELRERPGTMEGKQGKPQFQRPSMRRQADALEVKQLQRFPSRKQVTGGKRQYYSSDTSIERLHREATCSKLWQNNGDAELQRVPDSFASTDEYVQVFEPLLFEECRAQLLSVWEEACESSAKEIHIPVSIKSVEKRDRGWYDVTVLPLESRTRLTFKEGDVAVISTPWPGSVIRRRGRGKESIIEEAKEEGEFSSRVAGIVRRYLPIDLRDPHGAILFFHVPEADLEDRGNSTPNNTQTLKDLQCQGITWYLTVLGSLATTQREYVALHGLHRLHPQLVNAILKPRPELFPRYDKESPGLPPGFTAPFVQYLYNNFNSPQLTAIQWAALHTAAGTSVQASGKRQELWPFTLVQGPPGTGKTHTVWGMLNVIHLVQYQRYYAALLKKLAPGSVSSTADEASSTNNAELDERGGWIDEVLQKMETGLARMLPKLCPKPRMLVCAPSNAATDELLSRVLDRGFMDGEKNIYRPDVARVGVDPQTRAAQAVSVEKRTDQLLAKSRDEVILWLRDLQMRQVSLAQSIATIQKDLQVSAAMRAQAGTDVEPAVLAARDQTRDVMLQQLARNVEERDKTLVEMSRLWIVECFHRPGSAYSQEEARAKLEESFATEAEIVFTTVSSSGRRIFQNLPRGFDIVVIDESAQASEAAILPPLSLGAGRCVLVGDPQQLPATVISRVADTMQFSRSLFERFQQAGCPTMMLTVQYRMHPQIRQFPSRYFYQDRLIDSDSVKGLPDEVYHKDPMLQPYLFFDVSHGRESHSGSVSYQNIHEAQFAVKLYEHLQKCLQSAGSPKVTVGIISPYKLQLKCLQKEFEAALKSDVDKRDVYINSVDAFQGQERDVIIMSCVRASNHGVGFVADIRRMNVALTRARRSLWVIGNAATLGQSEDWAALIADSKTRGCFISSAKCLELGSVVPPVNQNEQGALQISRLGGYLRSRQELNAQSQQDAIGGMDRRFGVFKVGGYRSRQVDQPLEHGHTSDRYLQQHNRLGKGQ